MTADRMVSQVGGVRVTRLVWCLSVLAGVLVAGAGGRGQTPPPQTPAQQTPPPQTPPRVSNDPRVGLKPGLHDAGVAARGMELVSKLPKPEAFRVPANATLIAAPDPAAPPANPPATGAQIPPTGGQAAAGSTPTDPARGRGAGRGRGRGGPSELSFANSDLAFKGNHLFIGNFHGINTYNVEDPKKLQLLTSLVCPGGQGDVSVHGNLLFMSVEETRGRLDCGTQGVTGTVSAERFRGVRIFDISNLRSPKQIAAVQTCRGSHTHTLVVSPKDKENIYVYGSGTGGVRSNEELAGCSSGEPGQDPNTSRFSIDVIKVPLAAPETASVVNRPRIFADPATGRIDALWQRGDHGPGTQNTSGTDRCHDITVYPEIGLAAGACSGNGILLDISDPVNPVRLDAVVDKNFAFWHSATFNNDGTKVIFTDEWGGGTQPRCRATDSLTWGADAVFDIVDKKLVFGGYFKMPAPQTDQENCVAHNGSIIPVPGRDIMVQAWYQGGLSVFDFTDSANPVEIAYFDRGPISAERAVLGGYWSTYWYNGYVYGSEIARGVDVFRLTPTEQLTQNEIDAANLVKFDTFNAQHQPRMSWPASFVVAKAYVDQLARSKALAAPRATALRTAMDRAERQSGRDRTAALAPLDTLTGELEKDAASATGRDATRLKALVSVIKERVAALR
jgi:hypothetical protein